MAWPSRSRRPGPRLGAGATLLIVGGHDDVVLGLNRRALAWPYCENDLAVVPGASHLFEGPGTLDVAASLASDWFTRHMAARHGTRR
jgi:putative phosphoribosyl transferase